VAGEVERHQRTIADIEANQEKLVQLYYSDLVFDDVLRREQERLRGERIAAQNLLSAAEAETVDLQTRLEDALERIKRPYKTFVSADESKRRLLNAAVFKHIEVDSDGEISKATMTPVYDAFRGWNSGFGCPHGAPEGGTAPGQRGPAFYRPRPASTYCMKVEPRSSKMTRLGFFVLKR